MIEIKNIAVYGLNQSIKRSGFPLMIENIPHNMEELDIKDIKRSKQLAKFNPGEGHDNFLKGIIVQFDIKYPEYLAPEMQRYHWFEIVSSMSKMHRITSQKLNNNNTNKYVLPVVIDTVNNLIDQYNISPTFENFMLVLSNCPLGFEKWMGISTNYLQLKTIYKQRRGHRLQEWGYILNMIENLPESDLITKSAY